MAEVIRSSIPISAPIAPYGATDTYATHDSQYGKGGYHEVKSLLERDNISVERRSVGMQVFVSEDESIYFLSKGISNSNWKNLKEIIGTDITVGAGSIIVSRTEPTVPESFALWLNPDTSIFRYRDESNTYWKMVNDQTFDLDYGTF